MCALTLICPCPSGPRAVGIILLYILLQVRNVLPAISTGQSEHRSAGQTGGVHHSAEAITNRACCLPHADPHVLRLHIPRLA